MNNDFNNGLIIGALLGLTVVKQFDSSLPINAEHLLSQTPLDVDFEPTVALLPETVSVFCFMPIKVEDYNFDCESYPTPTAFAEVVPTETALNALIFNYIKLEVLS